MHVGSIAKALFFDNELTEARVGMSWTPRILSHAFSFYTKCFHVPCPTVPKPRIPTRKTFFSFITNLVEIVLNFIFFLKTIFSSFTKADDIRTVSPYNPSHYYKSQGNHSHFTRGVFIRPSNDNRADWKTYSKTN